MIRRLIDRITLEWRLRRALSAHSRRPRCRVDHFQAAREKLRGTQRA
jgi:hypothetical protein